MAELSRLVKMFEASEEASVESRQEAERARDYKDGNQLTAQELKTLAARKQPPVIENLIRPKIDSLCGLERQTRTDPACYPRTQGDDEAAQIATDALRYVADDQKLDIKRSAVFENMLTEGYGGVEIIVKRVRGGIDPVIVPLSWDRLFFDPHSRSLDFSDASYLGFVTWMDVEDAKANPDWKDSEAVIVATIDKGTSDISSTYADKPEWASWVDKSRKRIRIVTMYYKEKGTWNRVVYTLAGELEPCAPSPWLDEDGQPECGLIFQSAFVDRDNDRYGLVRDLFSLQDEVNKRRSKYLHLVNSRQVRVSRAFEGSQALIRKEIARPDGVIVADKDELEIIGTMDLTQGHAALLSEAKQAIAGTGPNAHMQGKEGDGQSGRAILAMQQAGMTEMAPLLDSLRDFNLRTFRAIWNRIRQFWTTERWVRVTDDDKAVKFFAVNTTKGKVAMQKLEDKVKAGEIPAQPPVGPDGQPDYSVPSGAVLAQRIQSHPEAGQPANTLAELDVDIQIDEVMNTPTLHAEQFEQLVNLASSGMMQIPPEIIIRASNLRDKQKLLDVLDEQKEQAGQMGQQQQELAQRGMQAEIAGKEAKAALDGAKAQGEQIKTALMVPQAQMQAHQQGLGA